MNPKIARGVAVFGGAIAAILVVRLIGLAVGSMDEALATTFVALGAASFALAIRDALPPELPQENEAGT